MASQPRVAVWKEQIYLDLRLLNKVQPMLPEIAQLIFEKNGLQKPTQNLINHIFYYLLSLIDPQFHSTLKWPLYDRDAERAFRTKLSGFISDYAAKGRLTDVKASFLVHPSSYKVTVLMEELTELAVKQMITQRIKGTEKQKLYDEVTKKYNSRVTDKHNKNDGVSFDEYMKGLNFESTVLDKVSIFLDKKQTNERIAQMLHTKITESEEKLAALNVQQYIDSIVDGFVEKYELDESLKSEILKIKNINEPAPIFDVWLEELDKELDRIEETWDAKVSPLLEKSRHMQEMSEELVKRELGHIEKTDYMLVYDPQKDFICTEELQSQVNSSQKYILKNMQRNGRLDFPKLIQAYVISMGYILKDQNGLGDGIHEFNERLSAYQRRYSELKSGFIALLENVDKAEKKLERNRSTKIAPIPVDETWFHVLNPPKISGLKMCQNQDNISSDSFTPLQLPRYKFNLRRGKIREEVFARPPPKSILTHAPKDDFLKTLLSRQTSSHDRGNMSVISDIKANETVAGCSSSFTRQQIVRLLSTNKKTSLRKHTKAQQDHDDVKIKKRGLSTVLNTGQGLFRSYSSPNLSGDILKRPISNLRGRKLTITQEENPQFDISGISGIERLGSFNTPTEFGSAESSRNTFPKISHEAKKKLDDVQREVENTVSPILDQEDSFKMLTAARDVQKFSSTQDNEQETQFAKAEKARQLQQSYLAKIVTAKDLPSIIITPTTNQEAHSSKMITAKELQEGHSSKMITARELQEGHSSKVITARELQEGHSSKMITARELQEGHSSKMITARELQEGHSFKMITARELQGHSSKMITPRELQEGHSSKTITAREFQEGHSSKMITPRELQEGHSSKMITPRELQEGHSSKMITAKELQEGHSSKMITARELQQGHSSKMITPRDLQEGHLSKMITPRELQEGHSSKMITARELQEGHSSKMITARELQEGHSSKMITAREFQEGHSSRTVTPRVSLSSINTEESYSKTTPKSNIALIKKTSSLEKIINRFKQVRSSVLPQPVREENDNFHTNDGLVNRNLLPDLLSPNLGLSYARSNSNIDDSMGSGTDETVRRGPRVSLGTMLGVDDTFLDQFDLID